MKVTVRYFGVIVDLTNRKEEILEIPVSNDCSIRDFLEKHYMNLKGVKYTIAINQEVREEILDNEIIREIALLPPFAGG